MKSFSYHRPRSVADAVALLRAHDSAKLLAGGQSLLPVMKFDLAEPSDLVSLAGIPALREIRFEGAAGSGGGELVIGALATHDEVSASPEVRRRIPALADLAAGIGDAQVRNRGTIGGSLAHADPAADYPAAVLALGATVETDRRRIAADDFFTGLFATALAADEIVTAVRFPVPERAAYVKFPHRASKYAVAGVMVAKLAAGGATAGAPGEAGGGAVRVAVTGAGPKVFRLPALEAALAARFSPDAAGNSGGGAAGAGSGGAAALVAPADLRADGESSPEYLAHLVTVMARRAIQACL
jgi:aerobic carbon-monoxide dehydrogenase medium subunit